MSDVPHPASHATPRPPPLDGEHAPTSPLTGQKRKEPMSAFSDSSLDAGSSSALIEASPAKMPPPPPPAARKDPVMRVKVVDPVVVVAESGDEPEPSTAADDVVGEAAAVESASPAKDEALAAAAGDIALEKAPGTPPSVTETDVEAKAAEEEHPTKARPPAARKGRPSRGGGTRGRKRPSDPPRAAVSSADGEEADPEPDAGGTRELIPELTGIAATVKNRRRKVAKYV